MKHLLLSPHKVHPSANAGWHFITAGIEYLLGRADENATFETLDAFSLNAETMPKADDFSQFDCVVLCGNPRWGFGEKGEWLYNGLLAYLADAQKTAGFRFLDAWQGAGYPLGMADPVSELCGNESNKETARLLKELKAQIVTRDYAAAMVCARFGLPYTPLPCSSYFGVRQFMPRQRGERTRRVVIAGNLDGYDGAAGLLRTLSRHHEVVATCLPDSEFCSREGIRHSLIYAPADLVALYLECVEVVSFRLHAAIPAAACGAQVYNLAVDSRSETGAPFGVPFGDYRNGVRYTAHAQHVSERGVADALKQMLAAL